MGNLALPGNRSSADTSGGGGRAGKRMLGDGLSPFTGRGFRRGRRVMTPLGTREGGGVRGGGLWMRRHVRNID